MPTEDPKAIKEVVGKSRDADLCHFRIVEAYVW